MKRIKPAGTPHQLQMFMTPREITSQYQPLDGDREDRRYDYDDRSRGPGNTWGEYTARSHNTQGDSNSPRRVWEEGKGGRVMTTAEHKGKPYSYYPGTETDQDVWDRKLEESQIHPEDYADMRGEEAAYSKDYMEDTGSLRNRASYPKTSDFTGTGATDDLYEDRFEYKGLKQMDYEYDKNSMSLHDSIRHSGVEYPVHLGSQFGSSGKTEVVGGHHRIAAALDIAPDHPIPVLHHNSISDARSKSNSDAGFGYR